MNGRKKFSQMTPDERRAYLAVLNGEISDPLFNPVKKNILEKIIQYATDQLIDQKTLSLGQPAAARYETCDTIFAAKNMAALPFLETVIQSLSRIKDEESKLRDTVLEDAKERKALLMKKHANRISGLSIALFMVSAWQVSSNLEASALLGLFGFLLYEYRDSITDVRLNKGIEVQAASALLSADRSQRQDGDIGDVIESTSLKVQTYGSFFCTKAIDFAAQKYAALRGQAAPAQANPHPGLVVRQ